MPIASAKLFGSTWFRGRVDPDTPVGPQDLMFENAEKEEHHAYLKLERPSRLKGINAKPTNTYGSFTSHVDFLQALDRTPEKDRCYYEILRNDRPVRLYFDFDLEEQNEDPAQALDAVRTLVKRVNDLLPETADKTVRVTCGSRRKTETKFKHSYHLVWPHVYFERVDTAMKHFALSCVSKPKGTDPNVYTKNRCMRTIGSHKLGDTVGLYPIDLETGEQIADLSEKDRLEYLISIPRTETDTVLTESDVGYVQVAVVKRKRPTRERKKKTATNEEKDPVAPAAEKEGIKETANAEKEGKDEKEGDDFLAYLKGELERFGYRHVEWLGEYQGGMRFQWDISEPDPLDWPAHETYHTSDDHALVTWDADTDEVWVSSFSQRVHTKRALLCSVSGDPLLDPAHKAWSPSYFRELLSDGKVHQANIHARSTVFVSINGNAPMLITRTFDGERYAYTFQHLREAASALGLVNTTLSVPFTANPEILKLDAKLDEAHLEHERIARQLEQIDAEHQLPARPEAFTDAKSAREYERTLAVAERARCRALAPVHKAQEVQQREITKLNNKLENELDKGSQHKRSLWELLEPVIDFVDMAVWRPDKQVPSGMRNLFTGYAVERLLAKYPERKPELTEPVHWHIKHVLCNGEEAMYQFFLKWLAHMFQNPSTKPGVCIIFSSDKEGIGKDTFKGFLLDILGKELGVTVNDDQSLVGGFNAHMEYRILVVANELGVMGATHKCDNKVRALVTDDDQLHTKKGVDSKETTNVTHLMMFTNEDLVAKIKPHDRRFGVIKSNSDLANQPAYVRKLRPVLSDPAVQVEFFRQMQELDIANFHFGSSIPQTDMRHQLMLANLPPVIKLLQELSEESLENKKVRDGDKNETLPQVHVFTDVSCLVRAKDLLTTTHEYLNEQGQAKKAAFYSSIQMASDLKKHGIQSIHQKSGTVYMIPTADELLATLLPQEQAVKTAEEVAEYMAARTVKRRFDVTNDTPMPKRQRLF